MRWQPLRRLLRRPPAANEKARALGLFEAGDYEAAAAAYEALLRLEAWPGGYVNLGYAKLFLGQPDRARAAFYAALALSPEFPAAMTGLGDACAQAGEHAGAAAHYRRALAVDPGLAVAHNNLSLSLTALGELEEAWREAEWRYELPEAGRYYPRGKLGPRWDGVALGGRRLLVHWEQGYGDVIQHLRFLPQVASLAPGYVFECPPPFLRLAGAAFGEAHVVESRPEPPPFELCAPLLSLPRLLGSSAAALPRPPYLRADAAGASRLRQEWSGRGARRLLGVAWRSSTFDPKRDVALNELLGVAPADVRLVSLQKETSEGEREQLRACGAVEAGSGFADFYDTAAAIAALDAVLSVDTSVAHLAGALDRPTWLLLSEPAAVRWMLGRSDTPWYPSMRLLRRAPGQAWEAVLGEVRAALALGGA
jgi:Flp pilus assembly protein TadD